MVYGGEDMDKIIKVIETSSENEVNDLLALGDFILLNTCVKSTENEECPTETEIIYSLGQTQLGKCPNCQDLSLEYIKDKYGIIEVVCNNHEQHYAQRLNKHRRYVDSLNALG